ncbi:MAG: NuoM family protein [Vampirovibrionales bacterium]
MFESTFLYAGLLTGLPLLFSALFAWYATQPQTEALNQTQHTVATVCSSILLAIASWGFFNVSELAKHPVHFPWMPSLGVSIAFGVDGISGMLVLLTALILLLSVVASYTNIHKRLPLYYSLLMVLASSLFGVFLSQDLFQFFLFYELELIPMYLLIAIWGGPNRQYASMKFVLYTLFGSVFLFAGILLYFFFAKSVGFDVTQGVFLFKTFAQLLNTPGIVQTPYQLLPLFTLLFLGFAVKLPMVPTHTWLPDAHVEAPTPVSMLLAGILLKMGGYGLFRLCFEHMNPSVYLLVAPVIALLGTINIVYTAAIAFVQKDMKKLIAYSSVSHMGFVLLGLAAFLPFGWTGAAYVLIAHGIVSPALFMAVGTLYRRTHTRMIADYSGFGGITPTIYFFFLFFSMASLGLPGLISFPGELLTLVGGFIGVHFPIAQQASSGHLLLGKTWNAVLLNLYGMPFDLIQVFTAIACIGVVIATAYSLYLVKRVFTGPRSEVWTHVKDINMSEYIVLGTLAVMSLVFGLFPNAIVQAMGQLQPYQPGMPAAQVEVSSPVAVSQTPVSPSIALNVVR